MSRRSNGEGTIRKRKDGLWEGRYVSGVDPKTGKFIRRSVYAKTRNEVKDKLADKLSKIRAGMLPVYDKLIVSEWLDTFLWEIKREQVKPKTFTGYAEDIDRYVLPSKLSKMKIVDVRKFHIQQLINSMNNDGRSPFVVRRVYRTLRNVFNEAEKRDIVTSSCVKNISLPKVNPKPMRIFSIEEQRIFFNAISRHRLEAMFILALSTGMREGELAALTWDDWENGTISVTKNAIRETIYDENTHKKNRSHIIIQTTPKSAAGTRNIPLMRFAEESLSRHRIRQNNERMKHRLLYANNGLIFCDCIGRLYDPKHFYCELRKIVKSLGLEPIKFHGLRHTFATRGLEADISYKALQELLGHETPEMVMHYQHLHEEQARIEINKLEMLF
jgi:integrase